MLFNAFLCCYMPYSDTCDNIFILIPADLTDHTPGSQHFLGYGVLVVVVGGGDFLCQVARGAPDTSRGSWIAGVILYNFGGN